MRHDGQPTNFAQNLGDLAGHDIVMMRLSDPAERERLRAEVGTEHLPVGPWLRMVVERVKLLVGRGAREPDADAQVSRADRTPSASPSTDAHLPPEHDPRRRAPTT